MTSLNFWQFFTPPPHCHAFYYYDLSTVVTKSLTPSPTVTSFVDNPLEETFWVANESNSIFLQSDYLIKLLYNFVLKSFIRNLEIALLRKNNVQKGNVISTILYDFDLR